MKTRNSKQNVKFFLSANNCNRLLRKIWPPSYYWYYRRWHQDRTWYCAKKLSCRRSQFPNLIDKHQLTNVGFREPGYFWQLGLPFCVGAGRRVGIFPWRFFVLDVGWYVHYIICSYNLYILGANAVMRRPSWRRKLQVPVFAATPDNQSDALKYWGVLVTVYY